MKKKLVGKRQTKSRIKFLVHQKNMADGRRQKNPKNP